MRVLIFHGYLLRGTGSNVYNASLAQSLERLGHEVHLLCQDIEAAKLAWVNELGTWREGELSVEKLREPRGAGSVTAYLPEIGGLLPVYVSDRYEGFEVKTFPELSASELGRYLETNLAAVCDVVERAGDPDAALANHLVMGPALLARAGLRFAVKVHGSDLSYTVRPHPKRFVPYAREGTDAASAALVGSRHTAEDLWATVDDPGLRDRTRLGPPGVDVGAFRPRPRVEALDAVKRLAGRLRRQGAEPAFGRDGSEAAAALEAWAAGQPRVVFVGKLLVNKGVDLLLAAWPLIHRVHPDATLLFAGFGAYRAGMDALLDAFRRGDLGGAQAVAAKGRAFEVGEEGGLSILSAFLESPPEGYVEKARRAAWSVLISGRLEHDEVAEMLPAADALVMPSTFPEAFGMVAAEAAACGVPPVSAEHSGMREVSIQLAEALPAELAPLLSFPVDGGAVGEIADRVHGWLAAKEGQRERIKAALPARARELWSWESVARGVISAARGDLDDLPPVHA